MKCPLLGIVDHERVASDTKNMPECLNDQCAWWDDKSGSCSILALSYQLKQSVDQYRQFLDRTRQGRQILKKTP